MSYLRIFNFMLTPMESYTITRNCSVCGCKSDYINTNNFRINANGNLIDVWLIYQCNKCKHTYNLTIFERMKAKNLSPEHYSRFMENDKELALKYGTDKSFMLSNKADINWNDIRYQIWDTETQKPIENTIAFQPGDLIQLSNPYGLKFRTDKILADILHLSRQQVKRLEKTGDVEIMKKHPSPDIDIILRGEISFQQTG